MRQLSVLAPRRQICSAAAASAAIAASKDRLHSTIPTTTQQIELQFNRLEHTLNEQSKRDPPRIRIE
ncbi:unnamed protein product [Angiostrongylus costaricensis]|uniref:Secreted protein n=1 Tax=Angiostrongylus costaricensis TaxID=334426 RepID=A0A0R3PWJ4_ANGCS|nr:unnamed protein product [Angiostrongylus costaricensis]